MGYPPPRAYTRNHLRKIFTATLNGHAINCSPKKFPCGVYKTDKNFTTTLTAGQIINITFYNPNVIPKVASTNNDQARHNGGRCEFTLSYDGDETCTVIGVYHRTCPDVCWMNNLGRRELYQNCADIRIIGNSNKIPLPKREISKVNYPDPLNSGNAKGSGPLKDNVDANAGPIQDVIFIKFNK
ncbi:11633_t:CDS:2 [Ambispora leptoticha]|uniref:11633_t:CDS:1 n=1 Tax=Ambispora leptoticha TaxID=144679 RepID=A0A9N9A8U0_9GLOM|nr:11633_t:CDS:2 [Ambispora leptoticha]